MKSISELVIGKQWDIVNQRLLHQSFNKMLSNSGEKRIYGKKISRRRPDVGVKFKNGDYLAIEVLSKTDMDHLCDILNRNTSIGMKYKLNLTVRTTSLARWLNMIFPK